MCVCVEAGGNNGVLPFRHLAWQVGSFISLSSWLVVYLIVVFSPVLLVTGFPFSIPAFSSLGSPRSQVSGREGPQWGSGEYWDERPRLESCSPVYWLFWPAPGHAAVRCKTQTSGNL